MDSILFWLVPVASVLALCFAYYFHKQMMKESEGTPQMIKIAAAVRKGAMSYLKQQYKIVGCVFLGLVILFSIMAYGFHVQNAWVPIAFLTGGFFSGLSGFLGMKTATYASARTANAARNSLNSGLRIAFRSGAVMGLVVGGQGLLDISFWYLLLNAVIPADALTPTHKLSVITTTMLTFGMGASTQALFARVGGGIYTKAADVGADLVGKVEAGIPEDDPRNPATIADNVGDNVGDVAGMGADLFESYVGSLVSAITLGVVYAKESGAIFPLVIAALGVLASVIGCFFVKGDENSSPHKALKYGSYSAAIVVMIGSLILSKMFFNGFKEAIAIIFGLVVGLLIGVITEIYTSGDYRFVKKIAQQSETGPATTVISGIAVGMQSTAVPIILIAIGIIGAYSFSGLYGIALAAVGMLSTTGITVAVDAYGPIADNAGGIAEMSGLPSEVRNITDKLDAVGNTTDAMGKGFAIGSAALTALALFVSYAQAVGLFEEGINLLVYKVIVGMFVGGMLPFLFSAFTMDSVSKAAYKMIEEVRRQFKTIPGILEGKGKPDYKSCVAISTQAALKEMLLPGVMAVLAPVFIGVVLGPDALGGLLGGALVTGVMLAIFMSNSGGAWDNAKKYIEDGHHGGKGSEAHRAAVVGDTVGDPFKDTSGPSINILIKLMTIVSLVFAPLFLKIGGLF